MAPVHYCRVALLVVLAALSSSAISQDMLYGVTRFGGQYNKGVPFQIRTNGKDYLSYKDFDGKPSDRPGYWSRLTQLTITPYPFSVGNSFAGLTEFGNIPSFGADVGSRFDFRAGNATVGQSGQYYFNEGSGMNPTGGLLAAFGLFYGTIQNGGSNNHGTLFEGQQIFGNGQNSWGTFDGPLTGRSPKGTPILASNGTIYGTTEFGGANDLGVIYGFRLGPTGLYKVLDFDGTNRGANPTGDLFLGSDNRLYGMTANGGATGNGVVFSVALDGSDFKKLFDFNGTNGAHPAGSLVEFSDGKLYGMTRTGGTGNKGVVFSITKQGQYAKVADFNGTNGQAPYGDLVVDPRGTALYGVTYEGGTNGVGVVFKVANGILTKLFDFDPRTGSNPVGTLSMVRKFPTVKVEQLTTVELTKGAFTVPVEATGSTVLFMSMDESTLEVNGNQLIPKKVGGVRVRVFQLGNIEYIGSYREIEINIIKSKQSVQFAELPEKKYGDNTFELTATSTAGLPVRFYSSNSDVATITDDNVVTVRNAGITYITAQQQGDDVYEPAEDVVRTLYVSKIDQTITVQPVPTKVCCQYFPVPASTTSGLPLNIIGDPTMIEVVGGYVRPLKLGKSELIVQQSGDRNYNPAEARIPVEVIKGIGIITFEIASEATFGSEQAFGYLLTDGGTITVKSDPEGVAVFERGRLYIVGVGTTTITVTQQPDENHIAANPVSRKITVKPNANMPTTNVISWTQFNPEVTLADAPFNLVASASSGLPVSYTSSNPAVASVEGSLVRVHSIGSATITARQAGTTTIPAAAELTRTITVNKKPQDLPVNNNWYVYMDNKPLQLTAYSYDGLPITYEVSDPSYATVENYMLTLLQPGTFNVTATQPGNDKYLPVTETMVIHAESTYRLASITALPPLTYGDAPVPFKTYTNTDVPVLVTSSDPNIAEVIDGKLVVRNAGNFTLSVRLNSPAFISETQYPLVVNKASQQITASPVSTKKFGDGPFRIEATSTSGLAVKVLPLSPVVSVTNNVISIVGSGKAKVQLEQSGNNNYAPATSILEFDISDAGINHDVIGTSLEGAAGNSGAIFSISTNGGTVDYLKQYPERTAPLPAAGFIKASDGKYYGLFRQGGNENGGQIVSMTDAFTGATPIFEFTQQSGIIPAGNLFEGSDGFLYGATTRGGEYDFGTLFRIAKDGSSFTVIYSFSNLSGFDSGGPMQASNGRLYGTTTQAGPSGYGVVYSITTDGSDFRILYRFPAEFVAVTGFNSSGELVQGTDGALYGTRMYGAGSSYGSVYKINPDGSGFTVLKDFNDALFGIRPAGRLMFASDGRIYGTTFGGGTSNSGVIYSLLPSGSDFRVQFTFDGMTGKYPYSALTEGSDGRLFGTTYMGGATDNGTIFAVAKDGSGFTKLYDLDTRAAHPRFGPLVESSPGVFFGTTEHGGALNAGAVFRVTTSGNFDIYCHCRQGEFGPRELLEDPSGTYLYGVTRAAEWNQAGSIFRIKKDTRQYQKIADVPQGETISTIFYASTGHLWVAGDNNNVNYVRRMNPDGTNVQPIQAYTEPANEQTPVTSFVELSNGKIFGVSPRGYNGPRVFAINNDGTGYRVLKQLEPYYYVLHPLLLASDGNVYLSSGQNEVLRITPDETITPIFQIDHAYGDEVVDIMEMNDGRLAFATTSHSSSSRSSLFSIDKDGSRFAKIFQPEDGQGTNPVDIKQSVDGWLYVMSSYGGASGDGVFYRVRPDGTSYEPIREFNGADASRPGTFMFNRAEQQLTFNPMAERQLNTPDFFPDITTTSGGQVTLTSSNPEVASIKDGLITLHKRGSTVITARLPANANYYDGGSASQTLVVTRGTQTITFNPIGEKYLSSPDFELNASSNSGLQLTFVSSNPSVASVNGSTVSIHAAGSAVITASQSGNDDFFPATSVTQTLTVVALKQQTITFAQIIDKTFGTSSFTLAATSTSGLPVEFTSSSSNIVINGNTVQVLEPGQVTITASQVGSSEYDAAAAVTRTFCINPSRPSISEDNTLSTLQLVSSSDVGNQWYYGPQALAGANGSSFTPTKQGSYQVRVTIDGCISEYSDTHMVIITAVEEWATGVEVYPNPVAEKLTVDLGNETNDVTIVLMSITGAPVKTINAGSGGTHEIDMSNLPAGMYLLQIESEGKVGRYKVLKR
ncbi:MAG: T9SS type A sorting domain-containing protein [Chryseolinea sp.]